jgi:type I restriction enzyme M protein
LGDTLTDPRHLNLAREVRGFDAIVSNPPYSIKWEGEDNPILINDERYSPAGILAPKSKADLAFTMHMLHHLSESGVASIVEFPGVLYRGGAEQKIRKYLLEHNAVDAVIQLPANLFFGVGIATCIIMLRKGTKTDNHVLFVDASNEFEKEGNKNYLRPKHQDRIAEAIEKRQDEQYFCRLVSNADIIANDCNLSVSSYVEQPDTREKIDIAEVNEALKEVVQNVNKFRQQVDDIVKMLEG